MSMNPPADEGSPREYTIDELASVTGVPSRTIRFYQAKGALPAPERKGRVAVYRDEHVERLRLVAELQDRGLRLRAIREVLTHMENGDVSVREWMGLGEQLRAPWSDDQPRVMTETEMAEFLGGALRPGLISALVRARAIEPQGNARPPTYLVPSPALLSVGAKLDAAGVDIETTLGAEDILRKRLGQAADELVVYFFEHAGHGFGRRDLPAELEGAVKAIRKFGLEATRVILAHEVERAVRQRFEGGAVAPPRRSRR
jgi:DNA-binding transcriptional MerR regulator